jgi:hypothetical protein
MNTDQHAGKSYPSGPEGIEVIRHVRIASMIRSGASPSKRRNLTPKKRMGGAGKRAYRSRLWAFSLHEGSFTPITRAHESADSTGFGHEMREVGTRTGTHEHLTSWP